MTDITIPDEAVEAATLAIGEAISLWLHEHPGCVLEDVETHKMAHAAILAALKAWPGSSYLCDNDSATIRDLECFILPLTQETDA